MPYGCRRIRLSLLLNVVEAPRGNLKKWEAEKVDQALIAVAAIGATGFTVDLWRSYLQRRRPHVAAYAIGMTFFAGATLALLYGSVVGWNGLSFRSFYLFGAIVNIPFLALGSVFLVIGHRIGRISSYAVVGFSVLAAFVTFTAPFVAALPATGIPAGSEMFAWPGPRAFALLGSGVGATVLIALGIASIFRFWHTNRRLVTANALIVSGVLAASSGGILQARGESAIFSLTLLLAAWLIWLGHRVASGAGRAPSQVEGVPSEERV